MEKKEVTPPKRWFSNGPGMDYARRHRLSAWFLNLLLYALLNMFYLRLRTGSWMATNGANGSKLLIDQLLAPLDIFFFPTYIIVIGMIMALVCVVPILTAQLYNLLHAVPFVLAVWFLGDNTVLSLCLFVSCAVASFEPLRFKSKFVASLLCLLPEILYFIIFGGDNPEQEVLRWAVLYAPWGMAFLIGVLVFGLVLGIGHFVRYRPGVLTPIFGLLLAGMVVLFHYTIGMSERDFQADVYRYSPSQVSEFRNRSIAPLLEEELAQRLKQEPYLNADNVKEQLRREWRQAYLARRLGFFGDLDPTSRASRESFEFYRAKVNSIDHIDSFMGRYSDDPRVSAALYYKALLFDLSVDLTILRDEDALRFYHDFPMPESQKIWRLLLDSFDQTTVSIEARLRLALQLAGQKPQKSTDSFKFKEAQQLLDEAQVLCAAFLQKQQENTPRQSYSTSWLGDVFRKPPPALTDEELSLLQVRMARLQMLISKENRTGHIQHEQRLAEFVSLNPHQLNYPDRLQELMSKSPQPDPLIDNIELAQAMLIKNTDDRITKLSDLTERYPDRDGGVEAMLELAQILLEKYHRSEYQGDREVLRSRSTELLQKITSLRPDSFLAQYAQKLLQNLPPVQ
jgi:hypothetical protein